MTKRLLVEIEITDDSESDTYIREQLNNLLQQFPNKVIALHEDEFKIQTFSRDNILKCSSPTVRNALLNLYENMIKESSYIRAVLDYKQNEVY